MMRLITFILIGLMFSACQKKSQPTVLKVQLPGLSSQFQSTLLQSANANSGDNSPWLGSISAASDINCYAVFIGGSEPENKQNHCKERNSGSTVVEFGSFVGGVPSGGTIEIEIESNVEREITLIAMQAQNGFCNDFHGDGPEEDKISHPRIVYQGRHNFAGGNQSLSISIASDLSQATEIDECDVDEIEIPDTSTPTLPVLALDIFGGSLGADNFSEFGHSVASAQDTFIVGVPKDNGFFGRVYSQHWDGTQWHTEVLDNPSGLSAEDFGHSVATDGNQLIVGAPQAGQGKAYVYTWDNTSNSWGTPLLLGTGASAGDQFGYSVAIKDDIAIVGAPNVDPGSGSPNGAAYYFIYSAGSWTSGQFNYTTSSPTVFDVAASDLHFGSHVAIDGKTVAVGAKEFEAPGLSDNSGAIFVYEFDNSNALLTTTPEAVLPDASISVDANGDTVDDQTILLGGHFSISGNTLVAGNPDFSFSSLSSQEGLVLVVKKAGANWNTNDAQILSSWTPTANENAGASVAALGDRIVFGAPEYAMAGPCGFIEMHKYDVGGGSWVMDGPRVENPECPVSGADDRFGNSVTMTSQFVGVGAKDRDDTVTTNGGAFLFPGL